MGYIKGTSQITKVSVVSVNTYQRLAAPRLSNIIMGPGMNSSKLLPSLECLMRESIGSDNGLHNHGKHQLGHTSITDCDRLSPTLYQPSQQGTKSLTMSMPRIPLTPNHMSVANDASLMNEIDSHSSLAIPSPISPRTTRCPSLSESSFSQAACLSPSGSGPTTPTSEHGGNAHGYVLRHGSYSVSRMYENRDNRYPGRSHSPQSSQRMQHHSSIHSSSLQVGISSSRFSHSMDPDTPMMPEHHEEKITKQEKRRRAHLNSEKRRRENIKGGLDALVELVPYCKNIQESKANILKKTREYIFHLMHLYDNSQMEVKRLNQDNKELRRLLALQAPPQQQMLPENLVYRARS
ncbi:hypothetical protein BGX38DRAFT_289928 [Terfezia claveryi]|nr:hypothetical protein BGX38DRAFT_289928 [Terfezia claveryi]